MESQDKEKEYEHSVWEIYRKEWATASEEKRIELNKRIFRWQELVKSGLTANQAYYRAMQEESDKSPIYTAIEEESDKVKERIEQLKSQVNYHNYRYYMLDSPEISDAEYDELMSELRQLEKKYPQFLASDSPTQRVEATPVEASGVVEHPSDKRPAISSVPRMRKAPLIFLGLALAASIVYCVVITGDRNALNTELKTVQSVLASTQSELGSTKQTLASTQSELGSTKQTLASTQSELGSTKQTLASKQAELTSTKQTLASTQSELGSTKQTLSSVQSELGTTKAELETAETKLQLYKDTLGIEISSGKQPLYKKGGLGYSLEINLNPNPTATNPSWQQLISFLLADPTDDETYWESMFNCTNFAEMLHNNAEAAGIKTAFVAVHFENETTGHALNAFKTTDRGLVYVDCIGREIATYTSKRLEYDKIAYVAKGREYGVVSIDRAASPEYSYYEQIGKALSWWYPLGIVNSIEIYW